MAVWPETDVKKKEYNDVKCKFTFGYNMFVNCIIRV